MTAPLMARCACPAAYALAECDKCTPTPPEGRNPDHRQPIKPLLPRTPAVDDHGLTVDHGDTQAAADLAATASTIAVAIIGVLAALTAALEHLRGRRRP